MKDKKFTVIISVSVVIFLGLVAGIFLAMNKPSKQSVPSESSLTAMQRETDRAEGSEPEEPNSTEVLPDLKASAEKNPDMVGWITLPNSRVNYPVMYTPNDRDFYLRRNFEKADDIYGLPYIDSRCSLDGDNYLIYGHETDNGSQFHDFLQYNDKAFWEKNKTFEYSTLHKKYKYEVVAFARSKVYNRTDKVFKYYKFFGSKNEQEFNDYISNIKKIALYDTGVEAKYGDHLLTLSMCTTPYHTADSDGRYVLVARRLEEIK